MRGGLSREVLEALKRLVEGLEAEGIRVEKVYVFGSRVRGDWLRTSDIDVVIVSRSWSGMRFIDRLDLVERIQWEKDVRPHIEAIPLTPDELRERVERSAVLRDASRYWIEVTKSDLLGDCC